MHRSGTSCLTGIMQGLGVELGEVFTENLYNKRGNRENGRIVFLNDALLRYNNASWDKPEIVRQWTPEMAKERDAIIDELSHRNAANWGFKDTRTLFTLPFWLEAVTEPRFIGTYRHPLRVAMSLNSRDGSPIEFGLDLWRRYNSRLLEVAGQYGFELADFDQPDDVYLDDVLAKLVRLGLDSSLVEQGRAFFDPALRNQAALEVDETNLPADVRLLYDELRKHQS